MRSQTLTRLGSLVGETLPVTSGTLFVIAIVSKMPLQRAKGHMTTDMATSASLLKAPGQPRARSVEIDRITELQAESDPVLIGIDLRR
jgi:hypothetical protein